ncbi:MAG TPA: hypothetical protein VMD79_06335 [Solirubrobacteraceae bacterium]|nr:hypothetical protein [Solirubrobacteraceae bacterium]
MAAVVAVFSFAALGAGNTCAAPFNLRHGLELSERGTPVPAGATVLNENFIVDGECLEESDGKLLNNDSPVDTLALEAPAYNNCQHGSLSGAPRFVTLSDTGEALVLTAPALSLTTAGPCVYEFGLLTGKFSVGEDTIAYVTGEATGIRSFQSSRSCALALHTEFAFVDLGADGFALDTELSDSPLF